MSGEAGSGGGVATAEGSLPDITAVRRLSRVEYGNTVRDVLYGADFEQPEFPDDPDLLGLENMARNLAAPALTVEVQQKTAAMAAEFAMADAATRAQVLPCDSWQTPEEQNACARQFIESFGLRAFRRPLDEEEIALYENLIREQTQAIDFEAAIELAIMAFLQAPQFNYRVDLSKGKASPFENREPSFLLGLAKHAR